MSDFNMNKREDETGSYRTYNPDEVSSPKPPKKPKKPLLNKKSMKGLIIFLLVLTGIVTLGQGCSNSMISAMGMGDKNSSKKYVFPQEYVGILEVEGEMGTGDKSSPYNQEWLLARIDQMKNDKLNEGLILSVNTPGGGVYVIDELYQKILEYKETGRPVYTYMRGIAASGGYYISAPSDKIYANRNTWTGSIGVTMGTLVDTSELLNNLGIKTTTITAGNNKAMGSPTEPLNEDQIAIFQGLVDEAYEQFTTVVSEGREMDIEEVKKLADGRIYTAKQALENGLIDEIGTLDDVVDGISKKYELGNCIYPIISYVPDTSLLSILTGKSPLKGKESNQLDQIQELMDNNNQFTINYLANVKR